MTETAPIPSLPLFYVKPEPITAERHGDLALEMGQGYRFAAHTNAVPIMGSEFAEAGRFYPIVFAGQVPHPVVMLGLERDNLFVDSVGHWSDRHYIPAYVRRYPFVFIETAAKDGFILGIDAASDRLRRASAKRLSDARLFLDAKPSPLTQEALRFSSALQSEHVAAREFSDALEQHGLLVPRQADALLPGGRHILLPGFKVVDFQRFLMLSDETVLAWNRKGWLRLIYQHLDSQMRWSDLLGPQAVRETPDTTNDATLELETSK